VAITTLDGLIAALGAGSQSHAFYKVFTGQTVGEYRSMWNQTGFPGLAANPSSGVAGDVPTDATAGAFPFTNPTAPALTYLARLAATGGFLMTAFLYDRLWQNSGLSPTTTTAQTVNSVALTRPDANGADVEAWFQVYATMGAGSGGTMTISYTDQDGNSGATGALSYSASGTAGRTFPYALASGDSGVRSIQSETHSATLTSGTYGLVLRRRLAQIMIPATGSGTILDALTGGLPEIPNDACLELVLNLGSTSAGTVHGGFTLIQG
jgi:hypothetical protein